MCQALPYTLMYSVALKENQKTKPSKSLYNGFCYLGILKNTVTGSLYLAKAFCFNNVIPVAVYMRSSIRRT